MKSICDPFIRRPIATMLLTISVVVFGIGCYYRLPVSGLPQVAYPVIEVSVGFPGMSPEIMANSIASPLEKEFMEIDGLKEVYSDNRQGFTSLTLNFELNKSIDVAAMDVQAAITRAQHKLPSDLPAPPTYQKLNPNSDPIFYLGLISNTLKQGELHDYAQTKVAQQMSRIDGVSQVQVFGAPKAVRIHLNLPKLKVLGIALEEVVSAIKRNSFILSTGKLKGRLTTLTLTSDGQLNHARDYEGIVVKVVKGQSIYLKDIARCEDGLSTDDLLMTFWGKDLPAFDAAVVLAVNQAPGANTVTVAKRVKALLPFLHASLPASIRLIPIYDKSQSILHSIGEVKETILIAFVLVSAVIFLFLGRARETLVPVVAMPLSLLLTFTVMKGLGYSLDNLSLMALTLAIGFLVDDAIVFLENVVRHMEKGLGPLEAAFKGAHEISFTILSMTLSLIATFLPLIFMEGQIGRVFKEFSVTIVVAIFASGLVSLTVTPVMCARFLKKHTKEAQTYVERFSHHMESAFLAWYGKALKWFLIHRWVSWWLWTVCLAGALILFLLLPKTFLPTGDSSAVMGVFVAKSGTAPSQMHAYQRKIKSLLAQHPSVNYTITVSGVSQYFASNQGFLVIMLKPKKERVSIFGKGGQLSIEAISEELRGMLSEIPGILPLIKPMPVLDIQTTSADNRRGKYVYTLSGLNPEKIYKTADRLRFRFMGIKGIIPFSVNTNVEIAEPELQLSYHRDRLFHFGLKPWSIENGLSQAYSLNYVYLIKGNYEQYQVILAADEQYRKRKEDLIWMPLVNDQGKMLSTENLVKTKVGLGPTSVCHKNNFPSASIFFNLAPGVPLGFVLQQIEAITKEEVSPDILGEMGGESKEFQEATRSLTWLLLLAIFVMYVVLGILYEHWIHPLTVLSTLPVALAGGMLTLYLFRTEFSLYAFIGLFMLMGIIKKNGIILVDFAVEKERNGMQSEEAIYEACLQRFRPILMTTVSTIFGILPIALGWGADGASRMPLGLSVLGGLLFAQVLTLFVTPVVYLGLNRFAK